MLARRQELNTQLQVLIDAFLLALSLFSPRTTSVATLRSREIREYRPTPAPERQAGGITCLWQISGRNQVRDFRDWVRLDLDYIDRWSLALDFKILLRTIPAVIMGRGAKYCPVEPCPL